MMQIADTQPIWLQATLASRRPTTSLYGETDRDAYSTNTYKSKKPSNHPMTALSVASTKVLHMIGTTGTHPRSAWYVIVSYPVHTGKTGRDHSTGFRRKTASVITEYAGVGGTLTAICAESAIIPYFAGGASA